MIANYTLKDIVDLVNKAGSITAAAKRLGIRRMTVSKQYNAAVNAGLAPSRAKSQTPAAAEAVLREPPSEKLEHITSETSVSIDYVGVEIKTPDELLAYCKVDSSIWVVDRIKINQWEVGGKRRQQDKIKNVNGRDTVVRSADGLWKAPLRQITITLKRRQPEEIAINSVLDKLAKASPKPPAKTYKTQAKSKLAFEIDIMDPHFGMHCFPPGADLAWSLQDCEDISLWSIAGVLEKASRCGQAEKIIFPFGNDFLHHDNVFHTTTAGTPQPEGLAFHHIFERGIDLAFKMVELLLTVAPVNIVQVPGNHDRQANFAMGHILKARYYNNKHVTVDVSASPYKFVHYGTNLIGFEHGHSVAAHRLPALMLNECRDILNKTTYREWHLGDQHRKATAKPSSFEEQGVSVEYLAALTPPNEWHRLKAYNWQKRGATGYVWNYKEGPEARVHVNLDSWTGLPTGITKEQAKQFKWKK